MPPYPLSCTSRALYRVFIAPNMQRTPQPSFLTTALRLPHTPHPPTNQTATRAKSYQRKDTQRHALSDSYTLDNAITGPRINFISLDGIFHKNVPVADALSSFNRTANHLLLVSPGKVDAFGRADAENLPTCKVISKMDLRAQHQRKLDIARRKSRGLGTGPAGKNLELNWAIAGGDLKHRLEKMKQFLNEGRKVEILLGPKRRGRVASEKECRHVLAGVRAAVGECKGAFEAKEPEGTLGGVMTLVFEGSRLEKKEKDGKEDNRDKAESIA